jgi:hypothetical protein
MLNQEKSSLKSERKEFIVFKTEMELKVPREHIKVWYSLLNLDQDSIHSYRSHKFECTIQKNTLNTMLALIFPMG